MKDIIFHLNSEKELLQKAIDTWGYQPQLNMVIEECAELSKAVSKYIRDTISPPHPYISFENPYDSIQRSNLLDDISDEIADVLIMIKQMILMYPNLKDKVEDDVIGKLVRLKERLAIESKD
jgi:NTP pyrophosphatase (non-canonical NTP hydrolase)